jgi:hypothetical protein
MIYIRHTLVPHRLFYYLRDAVILFEMHTGKRPLQITIPYWRKQELKYEMQEMALNSVPCLEPEDTIMGIPLGFDHSNAIELHA